MSQKGLLPEDVTVIIDTREQTPLHFPKMKTIVKTLPTGDYSIQGLEKYIVVERKNLSDLLGCVGRYRERFDAELQRLLAYDARALVIEATKAQCIAGNGRSKVHPKAVEGSLNAWSRHIHIEYCEDAIAASRYVSWFLWLYAKKRYEENKFLLKG